MRTEMIRGAFSALAAAVTLAMSAEHARQALQYKRHLQWVASAVLAAFAVLEADHVWRRAESILRI
jgi:hypothetical protein